MMRFGVLGSLTIHRDGSAILLNAQMLRRLLAVLLVNANRSITVDALIASLWSDSAPPGARKTVQIYMHRLRQALGDDTRIVQEFGGYRLAVSPGELDSEKFLSAIAEGRTLLGDGRLWDAAEELNRALALWRGCAYEDVNERPPVLEEARRLDEERLRMTSEHIDIRLRLGHHEDLVPQLAALTETHPYREDLRVHLMLALYRCGRQAEALNVFHATRRVLDEELGLEPGPALRRLHESILRSDPDLELAQPELHQPVVIPRELPAPTAGFAGRAGQLAVLHHLLTGSRPASVPIALITGSGGVGKTALALQAAHAAAERFPDGQLFIDLRGYGTGARMRPIEALTALLRSLGVPPRRIPIDQAGAGALYRSQLAGRRVLIVVDNARSADEVRALMPGTASCAVVVTSRDRLGGLIARDGAIRVPLDVLSPDEARQLVAQLLVDSSQDPESFGPLAEACAYLPLALRIAVAHLLDRPHDTVTDLVKNLKNGHRLRTLAVINDDTAAVRNAFAFSYEGVAPETQLVFRRLGVVPLHDFTPKAAAALADISEEQAEIELERLADAHLIGFVSPSRYTIHDLLRDYATERCNEEDTAAARRTSAHRLAETYLANTDAASRLLYPSMLPLPSHARGTAAPSFAKAESALAWLDAEHANIVVTVRHLAMAYPQPAIWLLADQLRGYYDRRRHSVNWLAVSRIGLRAARAADNDQACAAMFQMLGQLYATVDRFDLAEKNFNRALGFSRSCGWKEGEALAKSSLGILNGFLGRPNVAIPFFNNAIEIWRSLDIPVRIGKSLQNLATSHCELGNLSRSAELFEESRSLFHDGHDPQAAASPRAQSAYTAMTGLGRVLCLLGRYDAGLRCLNQALSGLRSAGFRPFEAYTDVYLSHMYLDLGRSDDADRSVREGVAISKEIHFSHALSAGLTALSRHLLNIGDLDDALGVGHEAAELATAAVAPFELAAAHITLSRVQLARGEDDLALTSAQQALDLCTERGFRLRKGQALVVLARIHHLRGNQAHAFSLAADALEIQQQTGYLFGEAEAHLVLAQCLPDPDTASKHLETARLIYGQTSTVPPHGLVMS